MKDLSEFLSLREVLGYFNQQDSRRTPRGTQQEAKVT